MFKSFFKKNKKEKNIINEEVINEEVIDEEEIQEKEDFEETPSKAGLFSKLKSGLEKTKKGITDKVDNILKSYRKIDEELFEELEEVLITADVGVETTLRIIEDVKDKVKERKLTEVSDIRNLLKEELTEILTEVEENELNITPSPAIVLVVGVNGVGKTTTIGKLAYRFRREGKKVLIAAGDTFRAAAIEQLEEWSNRANVDIISHNEGSDPAAVIFDGIQAAKARNTDILICDTAGRLHNKKNLMNELNKIFRIVDREYSNAVKEVLLVVDATTGQNAVLQAKLFKEACDISGIVLTKLDGTAKGGVVLAVQSELKVPVKLVGVGEGINDLQDFNPEDFVNAIFE
ncbi:signal recognition particle-docking protein FtsY [Clostridiisalibacter paucivorans]|uniref:signal recognition particle-docking protein FtsY n=1 Tax=Clostridiisalibacter paucivorans TaxID=408753 RepID=UPI000478AC17|nr:signal recognition particle-docking protein FtsY [Clostridiisalibacter paucivorans]